MFHTVLACRVSPERHLESGHFILMGLLNATRILLFYLLNLYPAHLTVQQLWGVYQMIKR